MSIQVDSSTPKKKEIMPKRVHLKNTLFVGGCGHQMPFENSVSLLKYKGLCILQAEPSESEQKWILFGNKHT